MVIVNAQTNLNTPVAFAAPLLLDLDHRLALYGAVSSRSLWAPGPTRPEAAPRRQGRTTMHRAADRAPDRVQRSWSSPRGSASRPSRRRRSCSPELGRGGRPRRVLGRVDRGYSAQGPRGRAANSKGLGDSIARWTPAAATRPGRLGRRQSRASRRGEDRRGRRLRQHAVPCTSDATGHPASRSRRTSKARRAAPPGDPQRQLFRVSQAQRRRRGPGESGSASSRPRSSSRSRRERRTRSPTTRRGSRSGEGGRRGDFVRMPWSQFGFDTTDAVVASEKTSTSGRRSCATSWRRPTRLARRDGHPKAASRSQETRATTSTFASSSRT